LQTGPLRTRKANGIPSGSPRSVIRMPPLKFPLFCAPFEISRRGGGRRQRPRMPPFRPAHHKFLGPGEAAKKFWRQNFPSVPATCGVFSVFFRPGPPRPGGSVARGRWAGFWAMGGKRRHETARGPGPPNFSQPFSGPCPAFWPAGGGSWCGPWWPPK